MYRTAPSATQRSSLARADAILAAFDEAHPTMSLRGIMARSGLPKTTVHRAVEKMVELGWLEHERDRYAIGSRLFDVANLSQLRLGLRESVLPYMEDLYEVTHETIHLVVLEDDHVLYAEKISGHQRITGLSRVGGRMPAYCTAVGKVLLAFGPSELVERVLRNGLAARTPATITTPERFQAELAEIRTTGIGFDREECTAGMVCVAAPLFGPDRSCVAAMSITGPARHMRLDRLAVAVRTAALGASRALRAKVCE